MGNIGWIIMRQFEDFVQFWLFVCLSVISLAFALAFVLSMAILRDTRAQHVIETQALQTELNYTKEQLRGCRRFVEPR